MPVSTLYSLVRNRVTSGAEQETLTTYLRETYDSPTGQKMTPYR